MSPRLSLSEVFLRTQTDERLCALAGAGHPRAFAVLVERHRGPLLRAAVRVGGRERAEDVVQEALLRAWRALAAGTRVEHVPAWLHRIVRNTAVSQLAREQGLSEPLPQELADPHPLADAIDARRLAHDLLARIAELPDRQRTALVETEFAGRSREAIAAELGLTEGAVRQLVHRARSTVRIAATALTPFPLATWVARRGSAPGATGSLAGVAHSSASRSGLLEILGAGSAAGTGALVKGGAAIIAAGALAGGLAWRELDHAHAHLNAGRGTAAARLGSAPWRMRHPSPGARLVASEGARFTSAARDGLRPRSARELRPREPTLAIVAQASGGVATGTPGSAALTGAGAGQGSGGLGSAPVGAPGAGADGAGDQSRSGDTNQAADAGESQDLTQSADSGGTTGSSDGSPTGGTSDQSNTNEAGTSDSPAAGGSSDTGTPSTTTSDASASGTGSGDAATSSSAGATSSPTGGSGTSTDSTTTAATGGSGD
ncbi:MAG TPA: sigma-70 family RNA polymerase sigma factor [Solirubrobacteraceae bacterium]|nr:sigma-70 family RNA polymerase sigma factor [Solirubrobacteraceae bacterium]